jgi:hypothetical protein
MGAAIVAAGVLLLISAAIEAAHRVNERRQERRLYTPLIHVRIVPSLAHDFYCTHDPCRCAEEEW